METKTTQRNTLLSDKKVWENPTMVIIGQNSVESGAVFTGVEGNKTVPKGTASYHS